MRAVRVFLWKFSGLHRNLGFLKVAFIVGRTSSQMAPQFRRSCCLISVHLRDRQTDGY